MSFASFFNKLINNPKKSENQTEKEEISLSNLNSIDELNKLEQIINKRKKI